MAKLRSRPNIAEARTSFKARHRRSDRENYGWGNFVTSKIYVLDDEGIPDPPAGFLAVAFGCHWEGSERKWAPRWGLCDTLEKAMDFCEDDMVERGTLPALGGG